MQYQGVVDNIPLGLLHLDAKYSVLSMNATMREWFPDVHIGEGVKPLCYNVFKHAEQDGVAWFCPTRRAFAEGRVHRAVVELEVKGENRMMRIISCPLHDNHGKVSSVIELFEDFTDYKKSEVAYEEQLHFLQSLLETTPLPIHYSDVAGVNLGCNKAFEELIGLSKEEIIGARARKFYSEDFATHCEEVNARILANGQHVAYERPMTLASGLVKDVIISKAPFYDVAGKPAGVVSAIMDISERKIMEHELHEAKERYRSIFENAVLGIFRTTLDGKVVMVSPSLRRMFGYESKEFAEKGNSLNSDVYATPHRRQEILDDLQSRQGVATYEALFKRNDGTLFFGSMNVQLTRDEHGAPLFLDGVLEDITERKKAEEQLRHAKAEAESASRLKSDFITTVTHELRTPLTSVLGFSKMLRKKLENGIFPYLPKKDARAQRTKEQVRNSFEMLMIDAELLSKLINDVIDLAKLESGQKQIELRPEPMAPILRQAHGEMALIFEKQGTNFSLQEPPGGLLAMCDKELVLDVLRQLLDNALKFTPTEGQVRLWAERDGDTVRVGVSDTGKGISTDDQEHIFNQFSQLGDTLTDKPKGTGLGLTICRSIVEQHGGEILVESTVGMGSSFIFTLQRAEPDKAAQLATPFLPQN